MTTITASDADMVTMGADGLDSEPPRVGWPVIFAYWLTQFAHWLALLTPLVITIAMRIGELATPQTKAWWLGLIMGVGALVAMVATPFWGWLSDRTVSRYGKRKLWIVVGEAVLFLGLVTMATASSLIVFGLGWLICQAGANAAQAALNAVLADHFPERQRGVMAGLLGTSPFAAIVVGVFITRFTGGSPIATFLTPWLLVPLAVGSFLVLVPGITAGRSTAPETGDRIAAPAPPARNPLFYPDFAWAFSSRFLVNFAYAFAITYQVYFMTDYLRIPAGDVARLMSLSTSLMGGIALVLSLFGGWLSDRLKRRKPFVTVSAALMVAGLSGMAMATTFEHMLWSMALISVGQGMYFAVDVALCVEVLPNPEAAARDLGILQIANSLPQSLAPVVAPTLLGIAAGTMGVGNYPLLFAAGAFIALFGAVTVLPIRSVR